MEQADNSYRRRVERVLNHIVQHRDQTLDLARLAEVACFSPAHFHRIFRAMTGMPLGELVLRIRMTAAAHALRTGQQAVLDVALSCGYESGESFARAFRRVFGVSPSRFRRQRGIPSRLVAGSCVCYDPASGAVALRTTPVENPVNVTIETLPAIDYALVRHVGPYPEIEGAIGELLAWAEARGIDRPRARLFTQSYDDPTSVPAEQLRSDACLALDAPVAVDGAVVLARRAAGRYATMVHEGPVDGISEAYQRLFRHWLPESGEEIGEAPCIERYLADPARVEASKMRTLLSIPLAG